MDYLKGRRGHMRADPKSLLPTAKSLICVGLVYNTPDPGSTEISLNKQGRISRYARGRDYHEVMRPKLHGLAGRIRELAGPFDYKVCVDTAPLLERAYAHHAGLGWIGKNTCLINQQLGSWVFLGELLTSLEIEPDAPAPFRCGTCTRCIEACPTDALVPTREPDGPAFALDSRRCISYFTIELRGAIPEDQRAGIGAHIFGCDICQDVCPWNRRAATTQCEEFQPTDPMPDLTELAGLSEEQFNKRFSGTPIERSRYRGFLRNVAVAMGNSSDAKFLEPLRKMAASEDAIVSQHAQWAMERIQAGEREG
jgi:epoxyqueuosine reductase